MRDERIDLVRGAALLLIAIDHVTDAVRDLGLPRGVLVPTLRDLVWSDAAEVFVFVSGLTFARVYGPRLARDGFAASVKRAWRRAGQLYLANLGALAVVWSLLAVVAVGAGAWHAAAAPSPSPLVRYLEYTGFAALLERPWAWLPHVLALHYGATGFDILPLYVVFLVVAPWLLAAFARQAVWPLAASGALWLIVQLFPALNAPDARFARGWFFNPLAWQLLFVVGLWVASRPGGRGASSWWQRGLFPVAALVLVAVVGLRALHTHPVHDARWLGALSAFAASLPLDKTPLAPLRLVSFGALALVTARGLSRWPALASSRVASPFVVVGRHALPVFVFGLVASYGVDVALVLVGGGSLAYAVGVVAIVAGSLAVALGLDLRRA